GDRRHRHPRPTRRSSDLDWRTPPLLQGRHVRLEPLQPAHADGIAAAAADGKLWELWFTSVPRPEEVGTWLEGVLAKQAAGEQLADRKSTRLNSSHVKSSY